MVSSTIEMPLKELLARLARIKREHSKDPGYKRWRADFPKRWPM